jgi:hypothetical protein
MLHKTAALRAKRTAAAAALELRPYAMHPAQGAIQYSPVRNEAMVCTPRGGGGGGFVNEKTGPPTVRSTDVQLESPMPLGLHHETDRQTACTPAQHSRLT